MVALYSFVSQFAVKNATQMIPDGARGILFLQEAENSPFVLMVRISQTDQGPLVTDFQRVPATDPLLRRFK